MLIGVFGGSFLPDEMAVHWGLDGEADGWMSPTYAFLIIPPIFLAVHWLCVILTNVLDKNAAEQNRKLMKIVLWIIPVISVGAFGMMVMGALGYTSSMLGLVYLLIGIPFIIIGNYMPKTSRNRTMGIKIKWTLANDENWAATHRFAGKVYVIVGFICLLGMALPSVALPIVLISVILICVILPIVYSYRFYKKQIREGRVTKGEYEREYTAMVKNKKIGIIIAIVSLALVAVIMFTGSIKFDVGESALDIDATFSSRPQAEGTIGITIGDLVLDKDDYSVETLGKAIKDGVKAL
jgi:uncharacterized membrane protein